MTCRLHGSLPIQQATRVALRNIFDCKMQMPWQLGAGIQAPAPSHSIGLAPSDLARLFVLALQPRPHGSCGAGERLRHLFQTSSTDAVKVYPPSLTVCRSVGSRGSASIF